MVAAPALPLPPESVSASASPIPSDRVDTIRMTLSVSLLTSPNTNGTIRLQAPRNMIAEGTFFALRYFINGRARRSVVQTMRVTPASPIRDIVSVRLISDTSVMERNSRREALAIQGRLQRSPGDAFNVDIADVSRSGVGFNSRVALAAGEVVLLSVGEGRVSAEIEIMRADENASVRFGARYTDAAAGEELFTAMIAEVWREPERRAAVTGVPGVVGPTADAAGGTSSAPSGMRARRGRSE
jgi:hypothetical protein